MARIDKSVLMECLHMLEDCDPTGERPDPPELADLEQRSLAQVLSSSHPCKKIQCVQFL